MMMMNTDARRITVDPRPYNRDLWTGEQRPVEFDAFGLVLGIVVTAIQREIKWAREAQANWLRDRRYDRAKLAGALARWYRVKRPDMTARDRVDAIAARMLISARDVEDALADAENMALAELS